ncbi:permease [Azorhizobium oxalatiphilum]|uniref:Permease n=1 Tax=Azorhizobium oxalatiphilum TaxID=980631 RepID=A0A917BZD4_9HYPH|nr:DMT family transporter [Azorhizobium oxalatiphilum]GGF64251.1 permease [Azorhizobium oxalatiphilum]
MSPADSTASTASIGLRNTTLAGIGMMLIGIFGYSLNDALGKWLVATYSVPQVMCIRGAFAAAVLLPFLWRDRHSLRAISAHPGQHALRMLFVILDVGCFYLAVAHLPLATVMTYYLAGPIYVTALSPFLLGEQVGWRRWSAVAVGFMGVLIALKPASGGIGLPELAAFVGSLSFGLLMIVTRKLRGASETLLITTQVVAPLVAGLCIAPFMWVAPSPVDFGLIGFLGIVSMVAGVCVNRALKLAPASTVVPYQYTFIIWATVFGYLFFGDRPEPNVLVGAAIIIGAGLFIFMREHRASRTGREMPPA